MKLMLRIMREEVSKAGQYCQAAKKPLLGMLEVSLWSSQWEDVCNRETGTHRRQRQRQETANRQQKGRH